MERLSSDPVVDEGSDDRDYIYDLLVSALAERQLPDICVVQGSEEIVFVDVESQKFLLITVSQGAVGL